MKVKRTEFCFQESIETFTFRMAPCIQKSSFMNDVLYVTLFLSCCCFHFGMLKTIWSTFRLLQTPCHLFISKQLHHTILCVYVSLNPFALHRNSFLFYVNFVCISHRPKIRGFMMNIFFAARSLFPKDNEQWNCLKILFGALEPHWKRKFSLMLVVFPYIFTFRNF